MAVERLDIQERCYISKYIYMKKKKFNRRRHCLYFPGVSGNTATGVAEAIGKTYRAGRKRRSRSGTTRCHFAWESRGENDVMPRIVYTLPLTYFKTRRWKNVCYAVYDQIGSISLGCRDVRSIYQMSGRTRGTCNRFNDTDLVPTTDTPYANPLTTISLLLEHARKPPRSPQSSSRSLIATTTTLEMRPYFHVVNDIDRALLFRALFPPIIYSRVKEIKGNVFTTPAFILHSTREREFEYGYRYSGESRVQDVL